MVSQPPSERGSFCFRFAAYISCGGCRVRLTATSRPWRDVPDSFRDLPDWAPCPSRAFPIRRIGFVIQLIRPLVADVPRLGIEVDRPLAALAAEPGILHAAERHGEVAHEPAVDPHHAGLERLGDAAGLRRVLGPERR